MKTKQNSLPFDNSIYLVGCDIVSLTCADNIKSFKNERYIKKILNQSELIFYSQTGNKFYVPPLYWSCKESAYKILLQNRFKSSFSPQSFCVEIQRFETSENDSFYAEALTYFENQIFFCYAVIEKEFVFSYACNNKLASDRIITHTEKRQNIFPGNQSNLTYNVLLNSISQHFVLDHLHLSIRKNKDGEPFIYYNESILNVPFSVSHDENFISFAFLKKQ